MLQPQDSHQRGGGDPVPLVGAITGEAKIILHTIRRYVVGGRMKDFLYYTLGETFGNAGWERRRGNAEPGAWCDFDLGAWAAELDMSKGGVARLRDRAVARGILHYLPASDEQPVARLGWNLDIGAWADTDTAARRARWTRPGAGRPPRAPMPPADASTDERTHFDLDADGAMVQRTHFDSPDKSKWVRIEIKMGTGVGHGAAIPAGAGPAQEREQGEETQIAPIGASTPGAARRGAVPDSRPGSRPDDTPQVAVTSAPARPSTPTSAIRASVRATRECSASEKRVAPDVVGPMATPDDLPASPVGHAPDAARRPPQTAGLLRQPTAGLPPASVAVAPTDAQGAPTDAPDDAQGGAAPAASAAPAGGKPPTPERAYRIALMEAIRAERGGPPPQHDAEWAATRRFWRLAEGGVPVERVVACYRAERRRPTWDSKPLPLQSVATVYPVYASDPAAFAAGVTRARRATQGAYERQTPPNTRGATHDPASQRPGPPPDHTPRPAPPDSAHGAPDAPGSAVEDASRAAIRERAAAARAARAGGQ